MEPRKVADAVADIRQYWGLEYTDEELFATAQRQWENARISDNAAKEFVLQVVACRLEEHLLMWLLQPHAADAAEDIQLLVTLCTNPFFTVEGLELLRPILDSLLTAAGVRAANCDRNAGNREQQMARLLGMMEGGMLVKSKAWRVLRTLQMCELSEDDAGAWARYLELPDALDPRMFNSRSGRGIMNGVEQVVSLQKAGLAAVRGFRNVVALDEEGNNFIADELWDLAAQVVGLMATKPDLSDDIQDANDVQDASGITVVGSMASLEEYLTEKAAGHQTGALPCGNGASYYETNFNDEDLTLSSTEQLLHRCSWIEEELSISSEILERVFDELSAVKNLEVISIQASFLLGMQMRLKRCFVDHCDPASHEFERRTRRVFNRLTDKGRDTDQAALLAVLAAFCPGQVIQQCIRGARTDVLHHSLFLTVLRVSPLLLDWTEEAEDRTGTLLERELQQALLDISSNQSNFDRESQNMLAFLLSLIGVDSSASYKRDASVMTATKLLSGVINHVFYCPVHSLETQLNLITLIQQLFQHLVPAIGDLGIDPVVLETSFNLVLAALCTSTNASDMRRGVLVRERLLLLLKYTMEFMPDPASMITLEHLDACISPSIWTLISMFNSEVGNDEFCIGLEDVATIEAYLKEMSLDDSTLIALSLPNVISAIQVLLWGLLWDSVLSENVSVGSTKAETWELLDVIAGSEFSETNHGMGAIKGSLLIQSAVAEMMLECGDALFLALLNNIIPYLLEYESAEIFHEDRLAIPKWAGDKLSEQPEIEQQISCQLLSTHSIMRYAARCWGLSGAANAQLAAPSNPLLVESFRHVLAAHDQAVTSSQRSLSGTLICIQLLCFVVSAAYEVQLDTLSTWSTVRTQTELSLLRLLHQLEHLKEISVTEAHFSQYFVAAWLAYLPAGQFEQAFNFIANRAHN